MKGVGPTRRRATQSSPDPPPPHRALLQPESKTSSTKDLFCPDTRTRAHTPHLSCVCAGTRTHIPHLSRMCAGRLAGMGSGRRGRLNGGAMAIMAHDDHDHVGGGTRHPLTRWCVTGRDRKRRGWIPPPAARPRGIPSRRLLVVCRGPPSGDVTADARVRGVPRRARQAGRRHRAVAARACVSPVAGRSWPIGHAQCRATYNPPPASVRPPCRAVSGAGAAGTGEGGGEEGCARLAIPTPHRQPPLTTTPPSSWQ